ncbi:MAG: flagellar biosynthesis protein FlhB [Lachnospiraceae bacterium]|nr:flagellar biosynthesis protein FlhB [Lachnospiraceae bacterium]
MLELDLQFFAKEGPGGEKTEEPTAKKLDDARKEGQVAKSKEVATALILIALFLTLRFTAEFLHTGFLTAFDKAYDRIPELVKLPMGMIASKDIGLLMRDGMISILILIAPFLVIGYAVAFLADYMQVTWKITSKPLRPKFNKLNPVSGVKRIFSLNSLVELLKSILKIVLISYIVYLTLRKQYHAITLLFQMPLIQGVGLSCKLAIDLGFRCALFYLLIAAADYAYQKRKFRKDNMMTKQEVKDEYKQAEGDPQIKGRIRQKMMEVSRRRMMQDIPSADVVITNPTHYAVAIRYDNTKESAPVVLAKGEDYLAQKIKAVAKENKVEIVENKPLARMLYHNVDIGEQVPPELYQAVAEVLAMVYHMQGKI